MASTKKMPTIEYYWSPTRLRRQQDFVVNVRIRASNGLQVAQITQGSQDKRDARRCVEALADVFFVPDETIRTNPFHELLGKKLIKETGPGKKPSRESVA